MYQDVNKVHFFKKVLLIFKCNNPSWDLSGDSCSKDVSYLRRLHVDLYKIILGICQTQFCYQQTTATMMFY